MEKALACAPLLSESCSGATHACCTRSSKPKAVQFADQHNHAPAHAYQTHAGEYRYAEGRYGANCALEVLPSTQAPVQPKVFLNIQIGRGKSRRCLFAPHTLGKRHVTVASSHLWNFASE
eukprot:1069511-Amphidinium_carterae.1